MDTTDPEIVFNEEGICSHCHFYDRQAPFRFATGEEGARRLQHRIDQIKRDGRGKEYDAIIGVSGGVDSSYAAYLAKKHGLRLLAVHCDAGWNSEIAVGNIERLVKKLDIDLITVVLDWEEIRDLQVAYFRAGLIGCDAPQDHAFVATVYHMAAHKGIRHLVSGVNFQTECIMPRAWGHNFLDLRHLRAVHRRFGATKLRNYPQIGFFHLYLLNTLIRRNRVFQILDCIRYVKSEAMATLKAELGWRDYGGKHYESMFTRFFQAYFLPTKFGFDKRRGHLSSLILSGQMSRVAALEELEKPTYPPQQLAEDKRFVLKKLRLSPSEWEEVMAAPARTYTDYPSNRRLFEVKDMLVSGFRRLCPRVLSKS